MSSIHIHVAACLALVLLLAATSPGFADSAYLQPEIVYKGDISELIIEYDSKIPSLYALDTSVLETDFEVLGLKSRVFRLVENGEVSHRMQWRLRILPRRSGRLVVPSLQFGGRSTPPLPLEVRPIPPALASRQKVFIEIESSTSNPYVGQQVSIRTRLYHNIPLSSGRIEGPEADDTLIHRQPGEFADIVNRNGADFNVLERGISLFPSKAGELLVSAASYSGTIDASTDSSYPARTVHRRSQPLKLQVRNPPPDYSGRFWLPASELEVSQNWAHAGNEVEVGDSLDWTLTIIARGLPAESLPADLLSTVSGNLRIYADQAKRSNRFDGEQLIGRLDQRFAIVASSPGELKLPALALKWWDVDRDSEQQLLLAGKTINVVEFDMKRTAENEPGQGLFARLRSLFASANRPGWELLLPLLLLVLIVYCARLLQSRILAIVEPVLQRRIINRRLRMSCLANDAPSTRNALLDWGRERWPGTSIVGLYQIAHRVDSREIALELDSLDAALYAGHQTSWQGQPLWRLIAAENSSRRVKVSPPDTRLPGLYPSES